uniref:F-box domain-containing protein n=1 Tax=Kalanchoe fedtschenkoi TaxID=63787 RepID=A0A7N0V8G7_KALFE
MADPDSIKRRKLTHLPFQEQGLIPGLPDHVAQLCLSSIHPTILYSVSHSWRRLLTSSSFPPYLTLYALLSPAPSMGVEKKSVDFSRTPRVWVVETPPGLRANSVHILPRMMTSG